MLPVVVVSELWLRYYGDDCVRCDLGSHAAPDLGQLASARVTPIRTANVGMTPASAASGRASNSQQISQSDIITEASDSQQSAPVPAASQADASISDQSSGKVEERVETGGGGVDAEGNAPGVFWGTRGLAWAAGDAGAGVGVLRKDAHSHAY